MRIILVLLAILPLAAMGIDLYFERERQAREKAFLVGAQITLIETLKVPKGQTLLDPVVLPPGDDGLWSVRGKLMLDLDNPQRRPIVAEFEKLCDDIGDRACWRLAALSVDGEAFPVPGGGLVAAAETAPTETATADSAATAAAQDPAPPSAASQPAEPAAVAVASVPAEAAPAESAPVDSEGGESSLAQKLRLAEQLLNQSPSETAGESPAEPLSAPADTVETALVAGQSGGGLDRLPAPQVPPRTEDDTVAASASDAPAPAPETATQTAARTDGPEAQAPETETGVTAAEATDAEPAPRRQADRALISNLQSTLNALGYGGPRPLQVDGLTGPRTENAIRSYQRRNSLPEDGAPTEDLLAHMRTSLEQASRAQAAAEAEAAATRAPVAASEAPVAAEAAPVATTPAPAPELAPQPEPVARQAAEAPRARGGGIATMSATQPGRAAPADASRTQIATFTDTTARAEPRTAPARAAAPAPAPAPAEAPEPARQSAAATASDVPEPEFDESLVYLIQDRLLRLGYDTGARDGKLTDKTRSLISRYQGEHGLESDGRPSDRLLRHMEAELRKKQN